MQFFNPFIPMVGDLVEICWKRWLDYLPFVWQHGIANMYYRACIAWYIPADYIQDIIFGIHAKHLQTSQCFPSVAHEAGHFFAFPNACHTLGTNTTWPTMRFRLTMRSRLTFETVSFHNTLETTINPIRTEKTGKYKKIRKILVH